MKISLKCLFAFTTIAAFLCYVCLHLGFQIGYSPHMALFPGEKHFYFQLFWDGESVISYDSWPREPSLKTQEQVDRILNQLEQ